MGNIFGQKKTLKEIVREQKRTVDKSIRGLERENQGLKNQEKKLIIEMKRLGKQNQMKAVNTMAKDLVRIRSHQTKFVNLTAQLRAMSLQMTEMSSQQTLMESMRKVTKSMMVMNARMRLPQLQQIMKEFSKQTEMMEMKQEMQEDMMSMMDNEDEEEESQQMVSQVLDEIGIDLKGQLVGAPQSAEKEVEDNKDKELEARLDNLRR